MSLERGEGLERAVTDHLRDAAPSPRADALPRLMRRVEASAQRSAWRIRAMSAVASLASGRSLATAAVAAGALVVGILIGQLGAPAEIGPQPSVVPTPTSTAEPVAWEEPANYSFVVEGCGPNDPVGTLRIHVADGVATAFEPLDERAEVYDAHPPESMPTLGQIMREVAEAQSRTEPVDLPDDRADDRRSLPDVRLTTDPLDGHPVAVYIDWVPEGIDDELCYSISEYDVAEAEPSSEPIGEVGAIEDCWNSRAASDYQADSVYRAEWSTAGEVVAWQEGRYPEVADASDLRSEDPEAPVLVCIYRGQFVFPSPAPGVDYRLLRVLILDDGEYRLDMAGPEGGLVPETPSDWREANGG